MWQAPIPTAGSDPRTNRTREGRAGQEKSRDLKAFRRVALRQARRRQGQARPDGMITMLRCSWCVAFLSSHVAHALALPAHPKWTLALLPVHNFPRTRAHPFPLAHSVTQKHCTGRACKWTHERRARQNAVGGANADTARNGELDLRCSHARPTPPTDDVKSKSNTVENRAVGGRRRETVFCFFSVPFAAIPLAHIAVWCGTEITSA